jgi:hypothetical protein
MLVAMLASCTDDYNEMILGTWTFESYSQKVTRDDGVVTEQTWRPMYNEKPSITFKIDGTLSGNWCGTNPQYINSNGEYILIATDLQWNKYAIQDDKIAFLNENGISEIYTISSMSSSDMVLQTPIYSITTYDSLGPVNGTMQTTYKLMKK